MVSTKHNTNVVPTQTKHKNKSLSNKFKHSNTKQLKKGREEGRGGKKGYDKVRKPLLTTPNIILISNIYIYIYINTPK